jgi:hypothetical protein
MERAARLFNKNSLSRKVFTQEEILRAAWPVAVGKSIAGHTSQVRLVRTKLVVEVEDAIWQKQLHGLRGQILERIHKLTGEASLEDVEFRVRIPRREPQRAMSALGDQAIATASPPDDESERIQDPVLKKVYQLSRRKATA